MSMAAEAKLLKLVSSMRWISMSGQRGFDDRREGLLVLALED